MKIDLSSSIRIEQLTVDHAADLFQLTDTNRAYLREWLPWLDAVVEPADTLGFIQSSIDQFESGQGPNYAVFHDQDMCGVAGFHDIDKANNRASIGYWLSEPCTGLGIMTKVVQTLLNIGFMEYGLVAIEIACATENVRSRGIPERIGARLDRIVNDAEWLYDHYVDHAVFVVDAKGKV